MTFGILVEMQREVRTGGGGGAMRTEAGKLERCRHVGTGEKLVLSCSDLSCHFYLGQKHNEPGNITCKDI